MTKLMDELVEIGAKVAYETDCKWPWEKAVPEDHRNYRESQRAALNAVLPVLYQRLDEADPGPPDGPIFRSVGIMSGSRGQCRVYMRGIFNQELWPPAPKTDDCVAAELRSDEGGRTSTEDA